MWDILLVLAIPAAIVVWTLIMDTVDVIRRPRASVNLNPLRADPLWYAQYENEKRRLDKAP